MLANVQYGCADQASVKQLGRLWWVLELRLPVTDWYRLEGLSVSPGADSLLSDTCRASELLSTTPHWSSTSSLVCLSSDNAFFLTLATVSEWLQQHAKGYSSTLAWASHFVTLTSSWVACLSAVQFPTHLTKLLFNQNNLLWYAILEAVCLKCTQKVVHLACLSWLCGSREIVWLNTVIISYNHLLFHRATMMGISLSNNEMVIWDALNDLSIQFHCVGLCNEIKTVLFPT